MLTPEQIADEDMLVRNWRLLSGEKEWPSSGLDMIANRNTVARLIDIIDRLKVDTDRPQAEPVAWQYRLRTKTDGPSGDWGEWGEWRDGRANLSNKYASVIEFEDRPLFTRPSTPVLEWGEKVKHALFLNGRRIGNIDYFSADGGQKFDAMLMGVDIGGLYDTPEAARDALMARAREWLGV